MAGVVLPGPVSLLTCGYFHNLAVVSSIETEEESLFTWGSNPQILRLEAQQRKKENMLKKIECQKNDAENRSNHESADEEVVLDSLKPAQEAVDPASEAHLSPREVDLSNMSDSIAKLSGGSQHSAILTKNGLLYTMGRYTTV